MAEIYSPKILCMDDDKSLLDLTKSLLEKNGFNVIVASSGEEGMEIAKTEEVDLILLDVMIGGMDGYTLCKILQKKPKTAMIPVIFLASENEPTSKSRAFASGAVDYLVKPFHKEELLKKISTHLKATKDWKEIPEMIETASKDLDKDSFKRFKEYLCHEAHLSSDSMMLIEHTTPHDIYETAEDLGISHSELAERISKFLSMSFFRNLEPDQVKLGRLPTVFCRSNKVIPLLIEDGKREVFVVANPFDFELLNSLNMITKNANYSLSISDPDTINSLLLDEPDWENEAHVSHYATSDISEASDIRNPVVAVTDRILNSAATERASDIHIMPKEYTTVVRFRIDGELKEMFTLKPKSGMMLISRLKVMGGLDISEKRKPQDGAFEIDIKGKTFNLRLATTSTPYGESLIIRMLEPYVDAPALTDLGMTARQSETLAELAGRRQGLILLVGPTGSGKTTTIYSLLNSIDAKTRSLISVEDPVEYRIPFANQQQVNVKAGVTFESLLKSSVRQDPDILFIGEIRDPYSAKVAFDFASTGHLTITTLHSSNATTAFFRLDRLGLEKSSMADSIIAIVAQRLMKKLCPYCRETRPITNWEKEKIAQFSFHPVDEVAEPEGCPRCGNTGYLGREGLYEVLRVTPEIAHLVRSGASIAEIRSAAQRSGEFLISNHAIEKVRAKTFSVKDVFDNILVEETGFFEAPKVVVEEKEQAVAKEKYDAPVETTKEVKTEGKKSVLVVEDDRASRKLIASLLKKNEFEVTEAEDGIEALLKLGSATFSLILSDLNMPNLDGMKLLELMNQKGITTPVVFLTGANNPKLETKALEMGALDFLRKPISKEALLLRIKRAVPS